MTREEAKRLLEKMMPQQRRDIKSIPHLMITEAFSVAIKALEQQPCEDCISREAVDEYITNLLSGYLYDEERTRLEDLTAYIWELPSVTPKQKTGRWLMPQQDDGMSDPIYYQVRCSECGFDLDPQTWHMELHQYGADKYCPNCGAKMGESEDKDADSN